MRALLGPLAQTLTSIGLPGINQHHRIKTIRIAACTFQTVTVIKLSPLLDKDSLFHAIGIEVIEQRFHRLIPDRRYMNVAINQMRHNHPSFPEQPFSFNSTTYIDPP